MVQKILRYYLIKVKVTMTHYKECLDTIACFVPDFDGDIKKLEPFYYYNSYPSNPSISEVLFLQAEIYYIVNNDLKSYKQVDIKCGYFESNGSDGELDIWPFLIACEYSNYKTFLHFFDELIISDRPEFNVSYFEPYYKLKKFEFIGNKEIDDDECDEIIESVDPDTETNHIPVDDLKKMTNNHKIKEFLNTIKYPYLITYWNMDNNNGVDEGYYLLSVNNVKNFDIKNDNYQVLTKHDL